MQKKVEGVQCFTSRFFNLLWYHYDVVNGEADHGSYEGFGPRGTPPDTPEAREGIPANRVLDRYRFWSVQSLGDGLEGGLFSQDKIFVPINISNSHWLFLLVDINEKVIELYDSIGGAPNPRNNKYMWAMRRFLYDMKYKGSTIDSRPNFEEWKHSWATRDMTRYSPKQGNDDDCGVFTILSIYLISRGVQLQRTTYDQQSVIDRKLRRMIAHSLMKCNEWPDPGEVDSMIVSERHSTTTASRHRKRRKSESRLTVGKSKVQKGYTGLFQSPLNREKSLDNRKRSAKSLTDAQPTQRTITQMLMQPPKRARKST